MSKIEAIGERGQQTARAKKVELLEYARMRLIDHARQHGGIEGAAHDRGNGKESMRLCAGRTRSRQNRITKTRWELTTLGKRTGILDDEERVASGLRMQLWHSN